MANDFIPLSAWTFARGGSSLIDEYIVDSEEYVGVGSGVFSYLDGSLYASTFSLREYDDLIAQGRMALTGVQPFSQRQQMRYRMMMDMFGLRFDRACFQAALWRTRAAAGCGWKCFSSSCLARLKELTLPFHRRWVVISRW